MANMSYCRFQNTLNDLRDCIETLRSGEREIGSREEVSAAENLISEMLEFVEDVGDDLDVGEYVKARTEGKGEAEAEEVEGE